jgi:hypothetical protein
MAGASRACCTSHYAHAHVLVLALAHSCRAIVTFLYPSLRKPHLTVTAIATAAARNHEIDFGIDIHLS